MNFRKIFGVRTFAAICLLGFALSGAAQPNLTPYKPAGWSDKIVVTRTAGSTTDNTNLTSADSLFVDWAVINNGNTSTGNSFSVNLYLDGVFQTSWGSGPLPASSYTYVTNYSMGQLSAGSHSVTIYANPTGTVTETTTNDNAYTKNFTIYSLPNLPAPSLISPANNSTGQSPAVGFSWSAVAGAGGYRIIAASSAADLPTDPSATNGGATVVLNATTTNTSYTPPVPFNTNTTYYWQVRAFATNYNGIWSGSNAFTTGTLVGGLRIIPTFDSSITSDPQAAIIEATINSAIVAYQLNFSDAVTVTITFQEMGSGLGLSSWWDDSYSYSAYRAALASHATTADDTTALNFLPNTATNPVNGNTSIDIKQVTARALGFSANPPSGQPDGEISLNTGSMNLSAAQSNPSKYSLFATVCHEIDEVLGLASALDQVRGGSQSLSDPTLPEDLFRYDQTGARSYTTSSSATAFFSLDGTTDLAQFNQGVGDFGDWYSPGNQTPKVQDAFLEPNVYPVLGVELRALDVMGFTRVVAVPAPVIQSIIHTGNSVVFTWSAVSGQNYQVQSETNVTTPGWTNLGSAIAATGSTASFTNIIGPEARRFYRIELLSAGGPHVVTRSQAQTSAGQPRSGSGGVQMFKP
jgi:hypothetical protein